MYYADLYDLRVVADRRELFTRLIQALATTSFALAAIYFWFPSTMLGRGVFLIASVLVVTLAVVWRVVFEWLSGRMGPRERLLLVGTGQAAVDLARELFSRRHELGVEIVGFIDPDPAKVGTPLLNPGVIGAVEDIPEIVRQKSVDRVVVSLADARGTLPGRSAPRHEAAGRQLRPPGVGLRGVHRKDRRREPAAKLVHLLGRLPQDTVPLRRQAPARRRLRHGAAGADAAADVAGGPGRALDLEGPGACITSSASG